MLAWGSLKSYCKILIRVSLGRLGIVKRTKKIEIEIENLANNQVLIIMKWAMKFPLFDYRETQRKWFGIKGKPWYVFVAVKTHADGEVEVEF